MIHPFLQEDKMVTTQLIKDLKCRFQFSVFLFVCQRKVFLYLFVCKLIRCQFTYYCWNMSTSWVTRFELRNQILLNFLWETCIYWTLSQYPHLKTSVKDAFCKSQIKIAFLLLINHMFSSKNVFSRKVILITRSRRELQNRQKVKVKFCPLKLFWNELEKGQTPWNEWIVKNF